MQTRYGTIVCGHCRGCKELFFLVDEPDRPVEEGIALTDEVCWDGIDKNIRLNAVAVVEFAVRLE